MNDKRKYEWHHYRVAVVAPAIWLMLAFAVYVVWYRFMSLPPDRVFNVINLVLLAIGLTSVIIGAWFVVKSIMRRDFVIGGIIVGMNAAAVALFWAMLAPLLFWGS
jgi:hypothetical protein